MISPALEVVFSERRGRHIVTLRPIPRKSLILSEVPYATVARSPDRHCSRCFTTLTTSLTSCNTCQSREANISGKSLVNLAFKILLRMLQEKDFSFSRFKERQKCRYEKGEGFLYGFEAIAALYPRTIDVQPGDIDEVVRAAQRQTKPTLTPAQMRYLAIHVFSILCCNVQALSEMVKEEGSGQMREVRIGSGVYPTLALFNHSCNPNTRIYFEGAILHVITTRDLAAGEEVFHNYGPSPIHMNRAERQATLERQYGFECRCDPCTASIELSTAFKCRFCSGPITLGEQCRNCGRKCDVGYYCARLETLHTQLANPNTLLHALRDVMRSAGEVYHTTNAEYGAAMARCMEVAVAAGQLRTAVECGRRSCRVVEALCGELSYTYAFELLSCCVVRIGALERGDGERDTAETGELVRDTKLCVELLSERRIKECSELDRVKEFLKSKC